MEITNNITCPYCNESYCRADSTTVTCMYFPPIDKDGVNVNPDKNVHTTYCTCLACGKTFKYVYKEDLIY